MNESDKVTAQCLEADVCGSDGHALTGFLRLGSSIDCIYLDVGKSGVPAKLLLLGGPERTPQSCVSVSLMAVVLYDSFR